MAIPIGYDPGALVSFISHFDKTILKRILKKFRGEAVKVIGREIKKIMQEEKRNTQSYLKRKGAVRGDAPHKIADSLRVEGPEQQGDTNYVLFGSFDGGTPSGVEGSRGGKIAELYEEGRGEYTYQFKGGGKGTAHIEGRPIVPSKIRGFGGAGLTLSNYLPPGLQRHPGYPRLAWKERTLQNTIAKLESNRIPDKLAQAFGENFYDKRFR